MVRVQMNKQTEKVLLAGTAMLLLFAATITVGPAMAQSNDDDLDEKERKKVRPHKERPNKERPHKNGTFAMGMGAAIEDDGDAYRSAIKLALAKSNSDADETTETDSAYAVRKGMVAINDEGSPVRYPVVADTWTIEFNDETFHAAGVVEDQDGNTYDVSVRGEALGKTKHGTLYQVQGEFDGDDEDYKLYYFVVVNEKTKADRPSTSNSESDSVNDSA